MLAGAGAVAATLLGDGRMVFAMGLLMLGLGLAQLASSQLSSDWDGAPLMMLLAATRALGGFLLITLGQVRIVPVYAILLGVFLVLCGVRLVLSLRLRPFDGWWLLGLSAVVSGAIATALGIYSPVDNMSLLSLLVALDFIVAGYWLLTGRIRMLSLHVPLTEGLSETPSPR